MNVPTLLKYHRVERYQCKICSVIAKDEDTIMNHMREKHCPHINVEIYFHCNSPDTRCLDCDTTLGSYYNTEKKCFVKNFKELENWVNSVKALGGEIGYWDKFVKRYKKWWNPKAKRKVRRKKK